MRTNGKQTFNRRQIVKSAGGIVTIPATAALVRGTSAAGGQSRTARSVGRQNGGELTFWVISPFTPDGDAAIYQAAEQYAQETGVTVNIESTPPASFRDKLITTVLGGEGPDVASVDSAWVAGLAAAEVLQPIDEQFAEIRDQFFDGPIETGAYLDSQYAVPWYTNNVALYWNKRIFAEVGLSAPATWDELVEFGKQLTSGEQYGLMLGASGFGSFLWFPFAWQNGATLISEDGKQAEFGSDAGKEAWQFFADLYLTHKIVPEDIKGATESWDQVFAPFIQERTAMMMTGDWGIFPIREGNPDLDFGIAPLPVGKEAATVIGGYDLGIPPTAKNPDGAWEFIRWLTAKEQEWVLQEYSRIQARKDIVDTEYATADPLIQVFIEQSAVGRARATVPQWNEIEFTILADAWDATILQESEPIEALEEAVELTNELLAEG